MPGRGERRGARADGGDGVPGFNAGPIAGYTLRERRQAREAGMSVSEKAETGQHVTVALLEAIGDAFNRHDVDAIMRHFAEDGVFDNARGPEIHGQRYVGKARLRRFFSELMTRCPDIQWHAIDNRAAGDKGFSEWRRQCTLPDGERQDWLGLDIFTFRDGLIVRKDTYFKIVE